MANQKVLEEYLVGSENSYLRSDDNNGKVIMLSGKWGSGKTHFWQEKVVPKLNEENNKTPNHYVSLYGKTSIDEIKNEVFLKVFESVDSFELKEKANKVVKNTTKLVSSVSKTITVFGVNIDLTKVSDKPFDKIDEILENKKLEKTQEYLNSGAIICFDDFERKSKEIDLNDLFGFITQLSLNFECKIVIILNDDVFEGKGKDIFSNVKEKTVSKYLYYNPSIKELFDLIFDDEKYKRLESHKELILKTIEETEELNARIYIQVLDNLLEWIEKTNEDEHDDKILRCLVLVNIVFILFHTLVVLNRKNSFGEYIISKDLPLGSNLSEILKTIQKFNYKKQTLIEDLLFDICDNKNDNTSKINETKLLIKEHKELILSVYILHRLKFNQYIEDKVLEKINNFIETGILIKDENK
ncbi:P-loop NTPase fold protein [Halarcobacter sp.]|uniref:P-loop NTPase fold protein n=1 Tax=Halarcobacter sp. TaxID=2321133 RepID=UPI003A90BE00